MKQDRCDLVKAIKCRDIELELDHKQVLEMESCIINARRLYQNDIATRLRILDNEGNDVTSQPDDIAIPALLNPLLGGKTRVLESGLMIEPQYGASVHALL